jgi:hypothetical protein
MDIGLDIHGVTTSRAQQRRAALRIASQIVAEHPDLTVAEIAADPVIAQGYRELHDAVFGTNHSSIQGETA